jgi:hypothetical protein
MSCELLSPLEAEVGEAEMKGTDGMGTYRRIRATNKYQNKRVNKNVMGTYRRTGANKYIDN